MSKTPYEDPQRGKYGKWSPMIQSVARQPELRGELQGIMWLGFALTEAVVFYGLLGGLLAFVLVK